MQPEHSPAHKTAELPLQEALDRLKQTEVENEQLKAKLQEMTRAQEHAHKERLVLQALEAYAPRDARLILRLMDLEQIHFHENGAPEGLNEQLFPLLSEAPYLFLQPTDAVGGRAESGELEEEFDMNAFLRGER